MENLVINHTTKIYVLTAYYIILNEIGQ